MLLENLHKLLPSESSLRNSWLEGLTWVALFYLVDASLIAFTASRNFRSRCQLQGASAGKGSVKGSRAVVR